MSQTHLVAFADGAFRKRGPAFVQGAKDFGRFDSVTLHAYETLPDAFRDAHGAYMEATRRGFGYWIWKPRIVLDALRALPADDLLVYLDAGYTLNPGGLARFDEYISLARQSPHKMLSFQNIFTEAHWTKADLARRLGLEPGHPHLLTSQISSGFFLLQRTGSNLDLLAAWADLAVEDGYRYSDDTPSDAPNHPDFQEHRHDQSIGSLLRKARGTALTHYEVTDFGRHFTRIRQIVPAHATRLKE